MPRKAQVQRSAEARTYDAFSAQRTAGRRSQAMAGVTVNVGAPTLAGATHTADEPQRREGR
jgi:hypothetical protein